jgi:periplasmic protein TonB
MNTAVHGFYEPERRGDVFRWSVAAFVVLAVHLGIVAAYLALRPEGDQGQAPLIPIVVEPAPVEPPAAAAASASGSAVAPAPPTEAKEVQEAELTKASPVDEQAQSHELAQVPLPDEVHASTSGSAVAPAPPTEAKEVQEAELPKASPTEDQSEVKVARDAVEPTMPAAPANAPVEVARPKPQREEPVEREKAPITHKRPSHAASEPAQREKAPITHKRSSHAASELQAASRAAASSNRGRASAAMGAVSTANYRSLVIAELSRHKQYPPAALSAGVQGTVVVAFTIGPSGRVVAHTIARSSGSSALDSAVNRMMAAISLPPPPGGSYRARAPVQFVVHR